MKEESETAIENIAPVRREDTVYRTIALLKNNLQSTLSNRAYADLTIFKLEAAIAELDETENVSPSSFITISFQARPEYPTPYPRGRYGNGAYPVFYAALEEATSAKERGHYYLEQAKKDGLPRTYTVFNCKFSGLEVDLSGYQNKHPELVSEDESGYPFCQSIANLHRSKADALYAPAARDRPGGVCTPVFTQTSLSDPHFLYWVTYSLDGDAYKREVLKPTLVQKVRKA